jgi:hypothetical protein
METVHANVIVLYGALAGNLFLALAAGVYALRRRLLPAWYWSAVTLVVVLIAFQGISGIVSVAGGHMPRRPLHLMYGALAAVTAVVQIGLRPGGFIRRRYVDDLAGGEARILALTSLTAFALIARAWMTGMGSR